MPIHGKNIRIYLSDGTVSGIRHAEIVNWTGQALSCPRNKISELSQWPESKRPGGYFLFGTDEQTIQQNVYIGEAENVYDRLLNHVANKEFWNEVIFFTNKDENLTKSHVKYLEARLIELTNLAARYKLENGNSPQAPLIPKGDRDAMEEFVDQAKILLGVLGHRALESLARHEKQTITKGETVLDPTSPSSISPVEELFTLNVKGIHALSVRTDEGIVVLSGSHAAKSTKPSLSEAYRKLREHLISQGILLEEGQQYRFTKDHLFSSPSQAAAIIVGTSINGRESWRTDKGVSLGTVEAQAIRNVII